MPIMHATTSAPTDEPRTAGDTPCPSSLCTMVAVLCSKAYRSDSLSSVASMVGSVDLSSVLGSTETLAEVEDSDTLGGSELVDSEGC